MNTFIYFCLFHNSLGIINKYISKGGSSFHDFWAGIGYLGKNFITNRRWLKKSADAENELARHDHDAEESFAKIHRTKSSQVYNITYQLHDSLFVRTWNLP